MAIYLAGLGMVLPQSIAGAMTPFPERAGAASALLGFVQQTVAALCGAIVGLLARAERLAARHRRRADGLRQPAAVAFDARACARVLNTSRPNRLSSSQPSSPRPVVSGGLAALGPTGAGGRSAASGA